MDLLDAVVKAAEMVLGRRGASRERVIEYLQTVADEATRMARIWREIERLLVSGEELVNGSQLRALEREASLLFHPQSRIHSSIDGFYRMLTTVVDKEMTEEYAGGFLLHLSSLLRFRQTARAEADTAIHELWKPVLLANFNERKPLTSLVETIDALDAEAATLRTLVATLRARQQ